MEHDKKTPSVKDTIKTLSGQPGIYKMLDKNGRILYIGKAKNLNKRVSSYFRKNISSLKTESLVKRIFSIETLITNTEAEALILEQNLIKNHQPPYNMLLRDDKSYPFIRLSKGDKFPRLSLYRGKKNTNGRYFGPYPNIHAAKETLSILQKIFNVRQCQNSFFKNRSRPCLQYHIKRCKAPCVDLVHEPEYLQDVEHSIDFLLGKSQEVILVFIREMDHLSQTFQYEKAALCRDKIKLLRQTQESQIITSGNANIDVIGMFWLKDHCTFTLIFIRHGKMIASQEFHPKFKLDASPSEDLDNFLSYFYIQHSAERDFPDEIIIPEPIANISVVEDAIHTITNKTVVVKLNVKGERTKWMELANKNAMQANQVYKTSNTRMQLSLNNLQSVLGLSSCPKRIECFDISHTMGESTIASCVVFDQNGAVKSEYRKFNINDITSCDDYAAIGQVVLRRYKKLLEENKNLPNLVLIDGGKGQLKKALDSLHELDITSIAVFGVAKGVTRKPGMEVILDGQTGKEYHIQRKNIGLHLIQKIRDEAHRFAISSHRNQRDKKRTKSILENIPRVGSKRRDALLKYFGDVNTIKLATVEELSKVQGVNREIAKSIYHFFHANQY